MKSILFMSVMLIAFSSCMKKPEKRLAHRNIDFDTTVSKDTVVISDPNGDTVGTYIPNMTYRQEHRLTINSKDGTIGETRLTMIIHQ